MRSLITEHRNLKETLLIQALTHVPFDGWGEKALLAGAQDLGIQPAVALNAFPGKAPEMVAFYSRLADRQMIEDYRHLIEKPLKLSERVEILIQLRMQKQQGNKEAVRSAAGLLLNPSNMTLGVKLLYRTVDAIWRELGDRSTDFNFYTKRGTLAAIYSATFFYWLEDKSDGHWETWAFLERRLADLANIPGIKSRFSRWGKYLPNPYVLFDALRKRNTNLSGRV